MPMKPLHAGDTHSGSVRLAVQIAMLVVVGMAMHGCAREAGETLPADSGETRNEQVQGKPSPVSAADAVLSDPPPAQAPDTRAASVRRELSELKAERAKLDGAVRDAAASVRGREADVARIRGDIADVKKRISRLKEEYQDDPSDETVKDKLYAAVVKLRGGEGVEGLESRLVRATAALADTKALADGLSRRLASLDSAIATAESQGRTVVDYVRFEEAERASAAAREAGKAVAGLVESTERKAVDVAAEDEAAKSRRDAALESMLEGL